MNRLHEKVVLIHGAGGVIGRQVALSFALEGAILVLCDEDAEAAEFTAQLIIAQGAAAVVAPAADPKQNHLDGAVALARHTFERLDGLVLLPATPEETSGDPTCLDLRHACALISCRANSALVRVQWAEPSDREPEKRGIGGNAPPTESTPGDSVRSNTVQIDPRHKGNPGLIAPDVAYAALFLISPESRHIHGQALEIGLLLRAMT